MKALFDWLNAEVKWGPGSVIMGLLTVLFAAIFVWQLIESGDPAEAGTRTAAIMTIVSGGLLHLYRSWQASQSGS